MTTYNTGNPVPSTDARDLLDNAQALDDAINSTAQTFTDRLGNARTTLFRAVELGMASVSIYPDHASGVAGVGEGGYFCVPAALDSEWLVLYRVEGGTYVEKKRLPSKARIDEIEGRLGAAETDITALDGRMDAAESNITAAFAQGNANAQAIIDTNDYISGTIDPAIASLDSRMDATETETGNNATAITALQQQVAELEYVPPSITALLIDGAASKTVEAGSSVASVALSWALSGDTPDSQLIDQGVGSVPIGTTSKVVDGPFTASRTWTLTVSDTSPAGNPAQDTAQVSLLFRQKRYWGVVDALSIDNAGILALASEFATSRQKTITYNASAGGYPYYCYPAAWGVPSSVKVGGLAFSDYSITTQSFTNASGHAEDYLVIRFNVRQTGSSIEVQFA